MRYQSKVLVTSCKQAKLTGFRRSKVLDDIKDKAMRKRTENTDNVRWRAPETMNGLWSYDGPGDTYQLSADVWGWAVTSVFVSDPTNTTQPDQAQADWSYRYCSIKYHILLLLYRLSST